MKTKIEKQLEEAKEHFYAWRMLDAYNILRRFFDRLPFQPDPRHAEYIGIFVRVLGELGRISELKFYVAALERQYEKMRDPVVGFALVVVYMNMEDTRPETSKRLCEELLRMSIDEDLQAKLKMFLATYYDRYLLDTASVSAIIDSIRPVKDAALDRLIRVWRGKVLRDTKSYAEAEAYLNQVVADSLEANDWYGAFSAQNVLAVQYIRQKRMDDARRLLDEMRNKFQNHNFKTVRWQLAQLQSMLEKESQLGPLLFIPGAEKSTFVYSNRTLKLRRESKSERLLVMLLRKRSMDKTSIVRNLYNREYDSSRDDKIVYYQIHSLRKRLKTIGLPSEAIVMDGQNYRWIPEVRTSGEEACA